MILFWSFVKFSYAFKANPAVSENLHRVTLPFHQLSTYTSSPNQSFTEVSKKPQRIKNEIINASDFKERYFQLSQQSTLLKYFVTTINIALCSNLYSPISVSATNKGTQSCICHNHHQTGHGHKLSWYWPGWVCQQYGWEHLSAACKHSNYSTIREGSWLHDLICFNFHQHLA